MHIFCDGTASCGDEASLTTTRDQIDTIIACRGNQACWDSHFEGSHELYCLGYSACSGGTTNNIPVIYALGSSAMNGQTIYSGGIGEMNITFGGESAGSGVNIWCDGVGDYCRIKCYGQGCSGTTVHCLWKATCDFDCGNGTGITCPTLNVYYEPTKEPTLIPSSIPTAIPTPPTAAPTDVPSVPPTVAPTRAPTEAPSISPSNAPSYSPSSTRLVVFLFAWWFVCFFLV